jgi:hypothetical protein
MEFYRLAPAEARGLLTAATVEAAEGR